VLDEKVGFLLRVAMQRHTAIFITRMIEGLAQTQFAALAKLYDIGPCSQNHLGRHIYLDAATNKGVVDRLAARGFLTAVSDPQDRRRRAVTLTERGRPVTEKAMLVAAEITTATLAPPTGGAVVEEAGVTTPAHPAQAGIQSNIAACRYSPWVPAFAGTNGGYWITTTPSAVRRRC